jgi:SAM-dependent methyltransferase
METGGRLFGEVAEAYHRHRPDYPRELFVELLGVTGLDSTVRVVEIGAGTGKATLELAAVAGEVVAVEPDAEMVRVAERALAASRLGRADVTFVVAPFEQAKLEGRFGLAVAAQAWHWMDAATKHQRAADLLEPGGWLVVLWHVDRVVDDRLAADLAAVHAEVPNGDALARRMLGRGTTEADGGPARDIDASQRFGAVLRLHRPQLRTLDAEGFVSLLETVSAYRALEPALRARLMARIRATIVDHGDVVVTDGGIHLFAAPVLVGRGRAMPV